MTVFIKKLKENAKIPAYATEGAAAMDLCACIDAPLALAAGARAIVPTGLAIALPDRSCVALICARSGLAAKHGICLANGIGVIDSDYRGELGVALLNTSNKDYLVQPGDRIAQLMFTPVLTPTLCEVADLDETARGAGGFGSTGKQ